VPYPRGRLTGIRASSATGSSAPYYSLETIWYLAQTASSTFSDYFQNSRAAGVGKVGFTERPLILKWLKGELDVLPLLDAAPPPQDATAATAVASTPAEASVASSAMEMDAADALALTAPVPRSADERRLLADRAQRLLDRARSLRSGTEGEASAATVPSTQALSDETLQRLRDKFTQRRAQGGSGAVGTADELQAELGGEEAAAVQSLLGRDRSLLARVLAREVPAKAAQRALQAPSFKFDKMVTAVRELRERELNERQQQQTRTFETVRQQQAQQHDRYNADPTVVWTGMGVTELGIDTGGSMLSRAVTAPTSTTITSPTTTLSRSTPTTTATSSSSASKAKKRAREEGEEAGGSARKARRRSEGEAASGASSSSKGSTGGEALAPIIVVPEKFMLTTNNVKRWLIDELFEADSAQSKRGPPQVELVRPRARSGVMRYVVVNDPKKLSAVEWERVVAVFVQGQDWQFKNWRWPTPAELFGHVRGYYLHFDDQKPPLQIKAWNVRTLSLSRSNRHSDAKAAAIFWGDIDDLLVNKLNA